MFRPIALALALLSTLGTAKATVTSAPTAQTLNGTYTGHYSNSFNQDFFLGIPYLQAPIGNRRFHPADSLTSTWNGTRNATSYAPSCISYNTAINPDTMSEDCLYLNIIRPHGLSERSNLPVAIFIHGDDSSSGSATEPRYNLSYIVQKSVQIKQPIIALSFNYRFNAWGFLYSNQLRDTGATNIGLRDQRFLLAWVQENIAGFGGDPDKVTLWGQGFGASSVAFQITAYAGRNDSLFRGAIMQSGNPVPERGLNGTQFFQPLYDSIAQRVTPSSEYAKENDMNETDTCWDAVDRMACLRNVDFDQMNSATNATGPEKWYPVIDGDIVSEQPSRSLYTGKKYLKVPVLLGGVTDEGGFNMPKGTNITTEEEFVDLVANPQSYGVAPGIPLPSILVRQLTDAYANISSSPYEKALLYQGDATINANRRQACATWSRANISAYCYRFDVPLHDQEKAQHGNDLPFAFANTDGYRLKDQSLKDLADDISSSWISFIATLDPNAWRYSAASNATSVTPAWPMYGTGRSMVFQTNGTSHVERDDWRATPIRLINGEPSGIAVAYQR